VSEPVVQVSDLVKRYGEVEEVPIGLSLGMIALIGAVLLGIAVAEFQKRVKHPTK